MESNYLQLTKWQRTKRRREGKGNFLSVRFADDFIVLCNGTRADAHKMKEELQQQLDHMGLKLSEEKTKVTHITEGFTFLGYQIIRSLGQSGKMVPKVLIPDKAIKRIRYKMREMLSPSTTNDSVNAKIMALNRLVQGWCQYYRATGSPSRIFSDLQHELIWGMAHWLGRKYKVNIPQIMRKFRTDSTFGTKSRKLAMFTEYKAKKLLVKTRHNPYTGTEQIVREVFLDYNTLWNGNENRPGWQDLRDEVILTRGTTCERCGTILHLSEVQVDHIIPRGKFRDPRVADRLENQQVLCTPCHRKKTESDRKVLSRMPQKGQVRF